MKKSDSMEIKEIENMIKEIQNKVKDFRRLL